MILNLPLPKWMNRLLFIIWLLVWLKEIQLKTNVNCLKSVKRAIGRSISHQTNAGVWMWMWAFHLVLCFAFVCLFVRLKTSLATWHLFNVGSFFSFFLKSLLLGDMTSSMSTMDGSPVRAGVTRRSSLAPPPSFCAIVVQLMAMQILALGVSWFTGAHRNTKPYSYFSILVSFGRSLRHSYAVLINMLIDRH